MLSLLSKNYSPQQLFIILMCLLGLVAGCGNKKEPPATSEPEPFSYQLRVQARTGDNITHIKNAKVTINVDGQFPLEKITDNGGLVMFTIGAEYVGKSAELVVEAADYELYRKVIQLKQDDSLVKMVLLEDKTDQDVAEQATLAVMVAQAKDAAATSQVAVVQTQMAAADDEAQQGTATAQAQAEKDAAATAQAEKDATATVDAADTAQAERDVTATAQAEIDAADIAQAERDVTATAQAEIDAAATVDAADTAQAEIDATTTVDAADTAPPLPDPVDAILSGKLAFPLRLGGQFKVYVVQVSSDPPSDLYASIADARQPVLSRDGQTLLLNNTTSGLDTIVYMPSQGGAPQPATCGSVTAESSLPTWSPDGQFFAFDGGQVDPLGQIYYHAVGDTACDNLSANLLTIQSSNAIDGNGLHPVWSTNNWLYFRSCATWSGDESNCGIWSVEMDGQGFRKITDDAHHLPTDANSERVLFMTNKSGSWDVYSASSTGGTAQNLTRSEFVDIWGTISPDGRRFAFMSNRGGEWAIWIANIDGSNPQPWLAIDTFSWGTVDVGEVYAERMSWSR